jgi:hypothetical protein
MMNGEDLRAKALKRAQDKVGFYTHFGIYVVMNLFFAGIWFFTTRWNSFPGFVFPMTAWGIGVTAHFISVFFGEGLVDRMTEQELARLRRQHG